MKLKKLDSSGFVLHLVPFLIVVIMAIGGVYFLVGSHADSPGSPATQNAKPVNLTNGCTSSSVAAPCTAGSNYGAGGSGWGKPAFRTEFTTKLLSPKWKMGWWDASTKNTTVSQSHGTSNCYAPSQVTTSGGFLTLSAIAQNCATNDGSNMTYNYASGFVNTAGTVTTPDGGAHYTHKGGYYFTYGFMEARIWIAPGSGNGQNFPAFWALGSWSNAPGFVTPEIDVMELLHSQLCSHVRAQTGSPGICSPMTNTAGWHTFGADWEPGGVTYYYDGQALGQITTGVPSVPLFLNLDLALSNTVGNPPIIVPSSMQVDWVRVWQHS